MLTTFAILTDGLVYAAYLFVVAIGLCPKDSYPPPW